MRNTRWHLVSTPRTGKDWQLFDLQSDPQERTNLIDRPEHAAHVGRLRTLMKQWQAEVGETLELPATSQAPAPIDLTGRPREPDPWQPDWIVKKYFDASP